MDGFVRKLVLRLSDPARPLSRNRHFHTFDNPEGKQALKIYRRLMSLRADLETCRREGGGAFVRGEGHGQALKIELTFERVRGRRVAVLEPAELALLEALPGVGPLPRAR